MIRPGRSLQGNMPSCRVRMENPGAGNRSIADHQSAEEDPRPNQTIPTNLHHRKTGNADHAMPVVVAAEVDGACRGGCSLVSSGATWILWNGALNQRTILPQPLGGARNVPW